MNEWTEVLFTYDEVEAEIVKDLLESEGIQVVVQSLKISPYPVSIGRMGEMRLMVRNGDIEKAKDILSVMEKGKEKSDQ
ncbi:MAG: DUF2007 domain-containing protein [Nitrospiraceae bacterium]|nr:MAG: DUF2007 domain-containing protein [Nitrospiraceae bacterium]